MEEKDEGKADKRGRGKRNSKEQGVKKIGKCSLNEKKGKEAKRKRERKKGVNNKSRNTAEIKIKKAAEEDRTKRRVDEDVKSQ